MTAKPTIELSRRARVGCDDRGTRTWLIHARRARSATHERRGPARELVDPRGRRQASRQRRSGSRSRTAWAPRARRRRQRVRVLRRDARPRAGRRGSDGVRCRPSSNSAGFGALHRRRVRKPDRFCGRGRRQSERGGSRVLPVVRARRRPARSHVGTRAAGSGRHSLDLAALSDRREPEPRVPRGCRLLA